MKMSGVSNYYFSDSRNIFATLCGRPIMPQQYNKIQITDNDKIDTFFAQKMCQ